MKRIWIATGVALVLIGVILGGCTIARMALPQSLASTTEMPVTGRQGFGFNKPLHFGNYVAADIHRGWLTRTKFGALGFAASKAKQSYWFKLKEAEAIVLEAQCATGVKSKDLELDNFLDSGGTLGVELESQTLFACTFTQPGTEDAWRLAMSQGTGAIVLNGILTDGVTSIMVRGTRELEGGKWPLLAPTGYHFVKNGQVIGAVEVINAGAVWMLEAESEEARRAMAAAASALLLYRDIKE